MTGRTHPTPRRTRSLGLPFFERLAPSPPSGILLIARIEQHTGPGRRRGRPRRPRRLGRPRRARSPAAGHLHRVVTAHPDARRGRPAAAGRPPPRRRLPGDGRLAASREQPQGLARRPVRDPLRDVRPDARRRRDHLGGRRRRHAAGPRRAGLSLHGLSRPARRQRSATRIARPGGRRRGLGRRGRRRARRGPGSSTAFPPVDGAPDLVDELLALHTDRGSSCRSSRSSSGSRADLRAAPVLAALRLAFLHTILPSSRLAARVGRPLALRITGGHVRSRPQPGAAQFRERNPWLAFEDGVPRWSAASSSGSRRHTVRSRPASARTSGRWGRGPPPPSSPSPVRRRSVPCGTGRSSTAGWPTGPRVRLVLGQPAVRPGLDRLAAGYHGTAWTLGREAASLLPDRRPGAARRCALPVVVAGRRHRPVAGRGRAVDRPRRPRRPARRRRCRGRRRRPRSAGASAGYRVVVARLAEPEDDRHGVVELTPPGAGVPAGPRTRANVGLDPASPAAPATRTSCRVPACSRRRSGSTSGRSRPAEAARVVTDAPSRRSRPAASRPATSACSARSSSASTGPGQLRRLAAGWRPAGDDDGADDSPAGDTSLPDPSDFRTRPGPPARAAAHAAIGATAARRSAERVGHRPTASRATRSSACCASSATSSTRSTPASPGRDRARPLVAGRQRPIARLPRRRWPTGSSGPCSASCRPPARSRSTRSSSASPRCSPATTCLTRRSSGPASTAIASPASTTDRLVARRRPAAPQPGAHRARRRRWPTAAIALGMRVWISEREQGRRDPRTGRPLGELLDDRERRCLPRRRSAGRADALAEVDAMWYIRGKVALLFEVEWTAILGDDRAAPPRPHRRRRAAGPLPRHRARNGPTSSATSSSARRCSARRSTTAAGTSSSRTTSGPGSPPTSPTSTTLEPLLGLDPVVERARRADAAVQLDADGALRYPDRH